MHEDTDSISQAPQPRIAVQFSSAEQMNSTTETVKVLGGSAVHASRSVCSIPTIVVTNNERLRR